MRTLLAALLLLCWASPLPCQQRVEIQTGTVVLPDGFTHRVFRGTDSAPGQLLRADTSLTIHYDIGGMAGTRVVPRRRSAFLWMVEHEVGGHRAWTGLFVEDGKRQMATTIVGDGTERWTLPANFTAEVRGERDVAEFLLIVASYRAKPQRSE